MHNAHYITQLFEMELASYTGAPYVVCVDNCSNAIYMALVYAGVEGKTVRIPSHTYPSVPCEIIRAGGRVEFEPSETYLTGEYQLKDTPVWDSALRFTSNMYRKGALQCLSFTGQWKHLKLCKGGAILTDSYAAQAWFRRFRFSGRGECSYFEDNFDMIGINCYMPPVIASLGLQMIQGFYNTDGSPRMTEDLSLPYPDLSKYDIYKQ